MKACKTVRGLLALRLSDWGERERLQVQSHLETCQACAALAQTYAAQERLFRDTAPHLSRPPQWDALLARVHAKRRWSAMRSTLGTLLTSAAVVAAIIGLAWGLSTVFERHGSAKESLQPAARPTTRATATTTPTETPLPRATPTLTAIIAPTATEAPTTQPTKAARSEYPPPLEATLFGYGIEAYADDGLDKVIAAVRDLNFDWLKQEIRWAQIEPAKGKYDWDALDAIVEASREAGIKVLLTIVDAPAWARGGEPGVDPPTDARDLAEFLGVMAARYRGKVQAYEIWDEQNTRRSREGQPLSAANYVDLLRAAYHAIKEADPEAIVVSGAPTPTGVNDGEWAIDDRVYLQQMYDAGLKGVCDAVGAHPNGYANPPDVYYKGGDFDPARPFDDHRSFFYRNAMEDAYQIMVENGDADKCVWATEFGWGTPDGLGIEVSPGYAFIHDIDEQQQAAYIVGAYTWAKAWGHAGTMFLYNLNVSPARSDMGLVYSIVYHDGSPRPAYTALKDMPK
jgi:hypothetical protein